MAIIEAKVSAKSRGALKKMRRGSASAQSKYYLDGIMMQHKDEVVGITQKLPNCFLIGAAKSGTTTLAATLNLHPSVFVSKPKEPKFFGPEYSRGWRWYSDLFSRAEDASIRIDASTMYSSANKYYICTPQLIFNYIEKPKFIYIARHPFDRIVSHWRHWKGKKPSHYGPFVEFLDRPKEYRLYLESSLYYQRLQSFRRFFPDEDILCLTFEELLLEPVEVINRVLQFLNLEISDDLLKRLLPEGSFRKHNAAGSSGRELVPEPTWDPNLKERVRQLVRGDAQKFLAHIGKPSNYWAGL